MGGKIFSWAGWGGFVHVSHGNRETESGNPEPVNSLSVSVACLSMSSKPHAQSMKGKSELLCLKIKVSKKLS